MQICTLIHETQPHRSHGPALIILSLAGVVGMNVMSFVLSLAAVVTWLAQFFLRLRKNVLIREDVANGGWNSEGEATVGYSFWLVFIASIGTDNGGARKTRPICYHCCVYRVARQDLHRK